MILNWRKAPDPLRPLVMANLDRLQRLFRARGKRFQFDHDMPTAKLEDALWKVVDQTALDTNLIFPSNMPCEHRISEIARHITPMPHPSAVQGSQWPAFLQTAR